MDQKFVNTVFSSVASKYDLMNDVMSIGLHRIWKNKLASLITDSSTVLDIAGGTCDLGLRIGKKNKTFIVDINYQMLSLGRDKMINSNLLDLDYINADVCNLPFENNFVEYSTMAFGIRNVENKQKALEEIFRVTSKVFICMEFAHIENIILNKFYNLYSGIIPELGAMIAKDRPSYQYLVDSIRLFPKKEIFIQMLKNSGFEKIRIFPLTFGVANIYYAQKP